MPARVEKELPRHPYSYRVTFSCRHVGYLPRPLPNLGDIRLCGQCRADVSVIAVDERELELWCPECDRQIDTFHMLATITAEATKARHNLREKRGHHAILRETGAYLSAEPPGNG